MLLTEDVEKYKLTRTWKRQTGSVTGFLGDDQKCRRVRRSAASKDCSHCTLLKP